MTARANYERKMAHTFSEDVKRADFQHKLGMDKMLMGNATSDERVANKRRARAAGEQAQVLFCCANTFTLLLFKLQLLKPTMTSGKADMAYCRSGRATCA